MQKKEFFTQDNINEALRILGLNESVNSDKIKSKVYDKTKGSGKEITPEIAWARDTLNGYLEYTGKLAFARGQNVEGVLNPNDLEVALAELEFNKNDIIDHGTIYDHHKSITERLKNEKGNTAAKERLASVQAAYNALDKHLKQIKDFRIDLRKSSYPDGKLYPKSEEHYAPKNPYAETNKAVGQGNENKKLLTPEEMARIEKQQEALRANSEAEGAFMSTVLFKQNGMKVVNEYSPTSDYGYVIKIKKEDINKPSFNKKEMLQILNSIEEKFNKDISNMVTEHEKDDFWNELWEMKHEVENNIQENFGDSLTFNPKFVHFFGGKVSEAEKQKGLGGGNKAKDYDKHNQPKVAVSGDNRRGTVDYNGGSDKVNYNGGIDKSQRQTNNEQRPRNTGPELGDIVHDFMNKVNAYLEERQVSGRDGIMGALGKALEGIMKLITSPWTSRVEQEKEVQKEQGSHRKV